MKNQEIAQLFFEEFLGEKATAFLALPQSGSARMNFIGKSSNETYVITYNENLLENEAFFYFTQVFSDLKLNTPQIFKINEERKLYIQEFLGEKTLSEIDNLENSEYELKRIQEAEKNTVTKMTDILPTEQVFDTTQATATTQPNPLANKKEESASSDDWMKILGE